MSAHGSGLLARIIVCFVFVAALGADPSKASHANERGDSATPSRKLAASDRQLLSPAQWSRLDHAVDLGLQFLARQQHPEGSFPTLDYGQPGVTSLCVMALLARGHQPGRGKYGAQIERAIDYVLENQDPISGAIIPARYAGNAGSDRGAGHYSHGISGVLLAEVYGMSAANRQQRIRTAVIRALAYTRKQQLRRKRNPDERGGWRYTHLSPANDSDLSVTAWQLMFLRSARNAEFDVPEEWVKDAMGYVHRSFDANERAFVYALTGSNRYTTRGMVGAGTVCLALGGEHQSETAKMAGDWILRNSFEPYNNYRHIEDRYHYGAFYCSQAMFQLGGDYWQRFFLGLLKVLTESQHADGSWDVESTGNDAGFGSAYTTALAVLALATPYQILPIYQR